MKIFETLKVLGKINQCDPSVTNIFTNLKPCELSDLLMFPPSATQSSSRRLAAAEARAGVAEAQGTYRPRLTSPSTGPPKIRACKRSIGFHKNGEGLY